MGEKKYVTIILHMVTNSALFKWDDFERAKPTITAEDSKEFQLLESYANKRISKCSVSQLLESLGYQRIPNAQALGQP